MQISKRSQFSLRATTYGLLFLLYMPLLLIFILSFNTASSLTWPPRGFSTRWWSTFLDVESARAALISSTRLALIAMVNAIVLGSMLSFALQRFEFFGKNSLSFLAVLPIALPGIVTGVALRNTFVRFGLDLGFISVIAGHTTFCIVVVHNNVVARLRRISPNLREASADLGANSLQTFRLITWPLVRSSVFAGAILAFALSFDEVVVTTFTAGAGIQTLPQWILNNFSRPNVLPYVTVVATIVMVISLPIAWLAQRLADPPNEKLV
ncbi:spermidine/putrescine ABC transporter permease [Actinomycetes bacterium]|nr:spermidine/putrescine ABC transporter permease [Actinomycetes bacterium]